MNSRATARFWRCYDALPAKAQRLARKTYRLWNSNPSHPSLHYKKLHGGPNRFSVRIGNHYRAIGQATADGVEWVWIGTHEEYNRLVGS